MLYPVELRAPYEVEYPQMAQEIGRGGEIRTPDILLPKQARYQTALHPENGAMFNISRAASLQGLRSLGQLQKSPFADI